MTLFIPKKPARILAMAGLFLIFSPAFAAWAGLAGLSSSFGKNDAALVMNPQGQVIFSVHKDKPLVPASTLKILTALTCLHVLGETYRFPTEFYLSPENDLIVKGCGDPMLVSEDLARIAADLKALVTAKNITLRNIVLDDTFMAQPISIPGITPNGYDPYNAPNGALCVNFNTVYFKKDPKTKAYTSAEPQTPLIPFALERIQSAPFSHERIVLSSKNKDNTLYAGHLLKDFLSQAHIPCTGIVRMGKAVPTRDTLEYTHLSPQPLTETVAKMLYFSNNFIANQLLISAGAAQYGAPGTLEKGISAAKAYVSDHFPDMQVTLAEGSGISRKNRISAAALMRLLQAFSPYCLLLKHHGTDYFKTGTLTGISTRVGFILRPDGERYAYVIMMNTRGKSAQTMLDAIEAKL